MPELCKFENCHKRAFYGYTNRSLERCKDHKEDRRLASSICRCGKNIPIYNLPGESKATHCVMCRTEEMVDVKNKKCPCGKRPSYNLTGEASGLRCSSCKTEEMVDVKNKKSQGQGDLCTMSELCKFKNCHKRAFYGYTNRSLERCKDHKEDRRLASSICRCGKNIPIYNLPGESKATHCVMCRTEEMVDVKNGKCPCGKRPSYNLPGESKGIHCSGCKTEEMVYVICKMCPCGKIPIYNLSGESKATHCVMCRTEEMVDVKNGKCPCGKRPSYNLPGEASGLRCVSCKTEEMVDVKNKRCPGQGGLCTTAGNKKYREYCTYCFKHMFPDDPLTIEIRVKTKELTVRKFIDAHFEGFIHDRQLQTNHCECAMRRRPDHLKLIGNTMLVTETDENIHKSYSQMDEETRYNDLYMVHSGKWVYIRFNPDRYKNAKSEWVDPHMSVRLEALKLELEKQIRRIENGENTELVERVYMYYDQV
jgi:hypothetical protein